MNRTSATLLMALSALCLVTFLWPAAAQSLSPQSLSPQSNAGSKVLAQATEAQPAQAEERQELEAVISSGASDAEEFISGSIDDSERWPAGYTYTGSSDLEFAFDTTHGPQIVGLHFESLGIPAGARVASALVRFTANDGLDGPVDLMIRAQSDPGEADPFVEDEDGSASHGISSRSYLDRSVAWSPEPVAAEQTFETPDLAPLLQRLVDDERWSEEASLVLMIEPSAESSNYRSAYSYDASPERAARLLVDYETDPAAGEREGAEATEAEAVEDAPEIAEPGEGPTDAPPETAEPEATEAEAAEEAPDIAEPGEEPADAPPETAEPDATTDEAAQPVTASEPDSGSTGQGDPQRVRYDLEPTHAAGVSGSVLLSDYGLGGTVLSVSVDEPEPDVTYRASLHTGACASIQNELLMLQPIDGRRGLSATIVDLPFTELTGADHHVNVFRVGERTRLAACADLAAR